MIETYKIITGDYRDVTTGLFNLRKDNNTRGIRSSKSGLELRSGNTNFFFRVTDPWNSLPDQVVKAPTVESFERRLDRHKRGHPQLYDFRAKK